MLTNKLNLPQPFVDAATSSHEYKPNRYSVTEVLGGTCEAVLKRRHQGEGDEDVADRVWAIWGTAVHKVLEMSKATDTQLQEQWFSVPVGEGGYELSGIFDLYDDATGTVTDWKTTSVWTVMFGDFEKWRRQTLGYCWMLRKYGFDAHRGRVVALLRDHSMRKAKTEKGYPPHPVFTIEWEFTEKDFKEIESDILWWFSEVAHEETVEDDYLEPCSREQRWHKPDKWAVMKKGQKRAVKLYDSEEEAQARCDSENRAARERSEVERHYIEFREGEDTRCQSYCSVAQFCPYGRKFFGET